MVTLIKTELNLNDADIVSISEFIKDRLYFITLKNKVPKESKKVHCFASNDEYSRDESSEQISRLSLGTISQFMKTLDLKFSRKRDVGKIMVNYSTGSERRRSNDTILIGVYAMIHLKMSVDEVAEKLSQHSSISPLDSLKAVQKAIELKFVDFNSFNIEDFYSLDDVKLHWVVPNKFLMFSGPIDASNGRHFSPRRYKEYFRHIGVRTIIRVCHIKYDANPFVDADIPHYDINIAGSVPNDKVLEIFLSLSEECQGLVLVHCREFLGRAACLVGAYLVKHFGMTAAEAVAWVRMCTSESILDDQKNWLKGKETLLEKAGEERGEVNRVQGSRGICHKGVNGQQQQIVEEESSRVDDVTAQLETELRVVNAAKSDNDVVN